MAVEFAQFFARFDVKVTLIQRSPHVLHEFDPDAATVIETVFRREGIRIFTGTKLLDARARNGKKKSCSSMKTRPAAWRLKICFLRLVACQTSTGWVWNRSA